MTVNGFAIFSGSDLAGAGTLEGDAQMVAIEVNPMMFRSWAALWIGLPSTAVAISPFSNAAPVVPAGAVAEWDVHPLESAAFSRRTP